jgi:hypothetical protein
MSANSDKIILSLCDYTGVWSEPYKAAGYDVRRVDMQHGQDVRLIKFPGQVYGIIAQPPCTHFAVSGARWWADKGEAALLEGLQVVDACLRLVAVCKPEFWVLENPVGRLRDYIGPYAHTFHPCDYAGYADDPAPECYTKKTCLWGTFNMPPKDFRKPDLGSKMHLIPPGPDRANIRSATPQGWARAFFSVNQ